MFFYFLLAWAIAWAILYLLFGLNNEPEEREPFVSYEKYPWLTGEQREYDKEEE